MVDKKKDPCKNTVYRIWLERRTQELMLNTHEDKIKCFKEAESEWRKIGVDWIAKEIHSLVLDEAERVVHQMKYKLGMDL